MGVEKWVAEGRKIGRRVQGREGWGGGVGSGAWVYELGVYMALAHVIELRVVRCSGSFIILKKASGISQSHPAGQPAS